MSSLQLSIAPGFYLEPQVASWVVSADVEYILFNQGGVAPAISEYIAYDTNLVPTPFLAVTQDGHGNVVYDGGFPKFYNSKAPFPGTTFANLTASFKFLYNALNWIADPVKVAAGNKKILILGDSEAAYNVKGTTEASDFKVSFDRITAIAGFTPTYKTRNDFAGGKLDARLAELNGYCAVLLMSSVFGTTALITDDSAIDMATFRSQGGGLMFITDHGQVINNISQANNLTTNSSFATANKVTVQFGAYFSGDYDRSPVNVGTIRANQGDHPLYNGMTNSEDIFAGGSESRVTVATYPKYYPGSLPNVTIDDVGSNVVQAVAMLNTGDVISYRGVFAIAEGAPLTIKDQAGNVLTEFEVGISDKLPNFQFIPSLAGAGTVQGEILRGTAKIGVFTYTAADGFVVVWYAGSADQNKVNNGSVITIKITSPFNFPLTLPVERFQPDSVDDISLAEIIAKLTGSSMRFTEAAAYKAVGKLSTVPNFIAPPKKTTAENVKILASFFGKAADGSKMPVLKIPMYATTTEGNAATSGGNVPWTAGVVKDVVLILANSSLFHRTLGAWSLVAGANLIEIYGVGRVIENSLNGQRYRVATNGTLVAAT